MRIGFECDGLRIVMTRWNAKLADAVERQMRFSDRQTLVGWLDVACPEWRKYATITDDY